MPRHLIDVGVGTPLLDLASYARRGPGRRDRLSAAEIELIARTINRAPEVMVKVLNRGGQDLAAVARHLDYLNREGELELETDDGQRLGGEGSEKELLEDWDLDLEEARAWADVGPRAHRKPPKLVQKLVFSMPPGTPPEKLLTAVKNFAREEFALKHRYAMVLHTDEPHPHVHMVVKAMGEHGQRLNVRRETLREWRRGFAGHLRKQGVSANATEREVRGKTRSRKSDGIYRAMQRGASRHMRERAESVAQQLARKEFVVESGKESLRRTRVEVERGWMATAGILDSQGQTDLARKVRRFAQGLPPVRTERELITEAIRRREREGDVREAMTR
jgi:Relaxase/Mobilisation nuclease domain